MAVPTWIQEVGTAGSLVAAFGVGAVIAARIARASVISGFRQKWIDELRQDIVDAIAINSAVVTKRIYLAEHSELPPSFDGSAYSKQLTDYLVIVRRIELRLNWSEIDHVALIGALRLISRLEVTSQEASTAQAEIVMAAARVVLKREWAVTKYGYWLRPMLWLKRTRLAKWLLTDPSQPVTPQA